MPNVPRPLTREMSVIAQDPSVRAKGKILMAKVSIPAEDLTGGPMGYRLQVVDYDSSSRAFHGAHDLPGDATKEPAAWQRGDLRIVKDYRFHAQNVYALIMKTLARFEFALGRRIGWSFGRHQLKVAPHGMVDANAFYTPQEEGLVFGYFPGQSGATGKPSVCEPCCRRCRASTARWPARPRSLVVRFSKRSKRKRRC